MLAVVAAFAIGPASAKTELECAQEYAAHKAAGAAAKQTEAQYVKACLAAAPPPAAGAEASQGGADANKLREAAQNPVANLISFQFQDNLGFGYGPDNAAQNILNFRPVIPIHLNADWNLIHPLDLAGRLSAEARARSPFAEGRSGASLG